MSVIDNVSKDTMVNIHFLYADIVKPISKEERNNWFEMARISLHKCNANIKFYDVSDKMYLLDGQNIGMWGKEISLTHYIYLLAPLVLDVDKVIYLDTDMIVNTDLSVVYNINMEEKLLAMGAPRGFEEMGDDVSNSGFVILNLEQWKKEDTLNTLLEFGRNLERCLFCDQNLLYQYFTRIHKNRLLLVEKEYNIFPQLFPELSLNDIKILHYTGYEHIKPWIDIKDKQRFGNLWWYYARKTPFYERCLLKIVELETEELLKNTKILTVSKFTYYRYKILSKILWGEKRKKYKQKYKANWI